MVEREKCVILRGQLGMAEITHVYQAGHNDQFEVSKSVLLAKSEVSPESDVIFQSTCSFSKSNSCQSWQSIPHVWIIWTGVPDD